MLLCPWSLSAIMSLFPWLINIKLTSLNASSCLRSVCHSLSLSLSTCNFKKPKLSCVLCKTSTCTVCNIKMFPAGNLINLFCMPFPSSVFFHCNLKSIQRNGLDTLQLAQEKEKSSVFYWLCQKILIRVLFFNIWHAWTKISPAMFWTNCNFKSIQQYST